MPLSMYDLSVPMLRRGLAVLSTYLDKAAAFAAEKDLDPATLVDARLATDMLPLSGQVQRASDSAKGALARLTGLEMPSFPDTETSLADLHARIDKTLALLHAATPAQFEGSEARAVTLTFRTESVTLTGDRYVTQFLIPNFLFHVATAHAILRQKGVDVGKRDFLGPFDA